MDKCRAVTWSPLGTLCERNALPGLVDCIDHASKDVMGAHLTQLTEHLARAREENAEAVALLEIVFGNMRLRRGMPDHYASHVTAEEYNERFLPFCAKAFSRTAPKEAEAKP